MRSVALVVLLGLVRIAAAEPTLTRPPTLVTFVAAEYPADLPPGLVASVIAQVDLDAEGTVTATSVLTSSGYPALDQAALAAIRKFRFAPAEIDGQPAPIRIQYQYDWKLDTQVIVKTTADFAGSVRDRRTGAPLAGIAIAVAGKQAVTDARGEFGFADLPPGAQIVTVSGPKVTAVQTTETLEPGKRLAVAYDVELEDPEGEPEASSDDLELVITAPKLARAAAKVEVVATQARRVAGTGGDVLKVVENLPGVARAAAGSGALVVWGASPEDTRVYVDGVRIPRLYHIGGLRSVISTDLVRSIALEPGGWGAEHGRGLGGMVDIGLIQLDDKRAGAVALDALDSSAALRVPIADHVRAAIALRKSHLAWLVEHATDRDVGDLVPIPSYGDAQLRVVYAPSKRREVEVAGLGSTDAVTRTVASEDPAATRSDERDQRFVRGWVRYHDESDTGDVTDVVVSAGRDTSSQVERFGVQPTEVASRAAVYGARASWRSKVVGASTLELGFDGELVATQLERRGSITVSGREGDVQVFGRPPPDQLAVDRWRVSTTSAAPYAVFDAALLGGKLHLVPGIRVEPYFQSVSRRTPIVGAVPAIGLFAESLTVQPRLAARYESGRLALQLSYGRYRQAAQPEDLSAVFGSPTLPVASAQHYVAGVKYAISDMLGVELTGFATRSEGLAVRSPLATPRLAETLEPIGEGRVLGGQTLLRLAPSHGVFGWISYTLSRAERRDGPGQPLRLFDADQTHVLAALASVELGRGFELGARVRYATGAPRTPVIGAYYDARLDNDQPLFGAHNATRLPAFVQLDVRVAKRFALHGGELETYLDLQNATDRENAEEIVYDPTFTRRAYITGLPILPIAGARYTW